MLWGLWLLMSVPAAGVLQGCGSARATPDGHHTTNPSDVRGSVLTEKLITPRGKKLGSGTEVRNEPATKSL